MFSHHKYKFPKSRPTINQPVENHCHYSIQIAVIGSVGSGKTSLINRYCHNQFSEQYHSTEVGESKTIFKKLTDEKKVKCRIWDAGFKDHSAGLSYYYLDKCDAVIFVADATSYHSLDQLKNNLIPLVNQRCKQKPIKVFAFTKTDNGYYSGDNLRQIPDSVAETFVKQQNLRPFISGISAKDGDFQSLNELFNLVIEQALAKQMAQKYKEQFITYLDTQLKYLPSVSEKYKGFNEIKLKINSKEYTLDELKAHVNTAKELAKQHRDTGIVGFFKGTWFRDPNSRKIHEETFDAQNNIKRHP